MLFTYRFCLILFSCLLGNFFYVSNAQQLNRIGRGLTFIENKGQWNKDVLYKAGKTGHQIYFEKDGWKILEIDADSKHLHPHNDFQNGDTIKGHVLKLRFTNTSPNVTLHPDQIEPYYHNY
ncbi:MAG: hypothetical protein RL138_695, partial [Bacteroidota bacterium]